ncbi:hypothetical protein HmCmsJML027_04091 [Escherichia coli]|nr:hypothetical protein HmCmsJML027_04091 [Escherichia coli]
MVNNINTACSMELTVNEPSILKFNVIERKNKMKKGNNNVTYTHLTTTHNLVVL